MYLKAYRTFLFLASSIFFTVAFQGNTLAQDNSGQKIIVGGTGDSQKLLRKVAGALQEKIGSNTIVIPDTIGSTGGIKALIAGKIDLARVARPLKTEEKSRGLNYLLFARAPVVFVVHPSVSDLNDITSENLSGIYQGEITDWKQLGSIRHKIYPVARESRNSSYKIIKKNFPDFRVNRETTKTLYNNTETLQALESNPYTIGFMPLNDTIGTNLRVLKFNGIKASDENVRSGKYPLAMPLGIVYKNKPTGLAKIFIDFLYSPEGQKVITEFGAIPINR